LNFNQKPWDEAFIFNLGQQGPNAAAAAARMDISASQGLAPMPIGADISNPAI
jgi:hypothetical protein